MGFVIYRIENIVRKGENDANKHSFFFARCFQKASLSEYNSLRYDEYLDLTKFKAVLDDKMNVA